jgi:hypothetical protein
MLGRELDSYGSVCGPMAGVCEEKKESSPIKEGNLADFLSACQEGLSPLELVDV